VLAFLFSMLLFSLAGFRPGGFFAPSSTCSNAGVEANLVVSP
jgi:hypothetical protein